MTRSARIACAILSLVVLSPTRAGADAAGFAFLEIPVGARAAGLGGAYVSLAQGVEAAYWNPAGLPGVRGVQIVGGHDELFQKLRHDHFAVARQLLGWGVSGSVRALYSEPIPERDDLGNLIGSFGANDLEFALGLGHAVGSGLSLGGTAQMLHERIANAGATTYAFGAGATWEPPGDHGLRLGMSVRNLGPSAHFTFDEVRGDPVALPAAVQAGVSYARDLGARLDLNGALEARFTRGRAGIAMAGAEVTSPIGAAVRVGARMNDSAANLSLGVGYAMRSLHLDYAFVPLHLDDGVDLGDTHRFSFMAQF